MHTCTHYTHTCTHPSTLKILFDFSILYLCVWIYCATVIKRKRDEMHTTCIMQRKYKMIELEPAKHLMIWIAISNQIRCRCAWKSWKLNFSTAADNDKNVQNNSCDHEFGWVFKSIDISYSGWRHNAVYRQVSSHWISLKIWFYFHEIQIMYWWMKKSTNITNKIYNDDDGNGDAQAIISHV